MYITLKDIGPIRYTSFELNDLTIICGSNNTGKTYATYSLFGFLDSWKGMLIDIKENPEDITFSNLISSDGICINLKNCIQYTIDYVSRACDIYSKSLYEVFASNESRFKDCEFMIHLEESDFDDALSREYSRTSRVPVMSSSGGLNSATLKFTKKENSSDLFVQFFFGLEDFDLDDLNKQIPPKYIELLVWRTVVNALTDNLIPSPYISSAERTGAAIFRQDLDFARNNFIDAIKKYGADDIGAVFQSSADFQYPIPVQSNVDFMRSLESQSKKDSYIKKNHSYILRNFQNIIGGSYGITKSNVIQYTPSIKKSIRLSVDDASSSVRSLLDVGFYLKHVAKQGDILMIDEPELNLHPENQRKVARLLASLTNIGIKVFITTHSDYIIRELNTLILLYQSRDISLEHPVISNEKYTKEELLSPQDVNVYRTGKKSILVPENKRKTSINTLIECPIDDMGISVESFDLSINIMNSIQDFIIWGQQ